MSRAYIEASIRRTRNGEITRRKERRAFFEYLAAYDEMDPDQVMESLKGCVKPKEVIIAVKVHLPGGENEEWRINKAVSKITTLNGRINPNILLDYPTDLLDEIEKEITELSTQGLSEAEIDEIIGFSYHIK